MYIYYYLSCTWAYNIPYTMNRASCAQVHELP